MSTNYRSARTSLLIFDTVTWLAVAALTLIALKLFSNGTELPATLMGVGIWLFAIFEFAFTQFARAQIDTADNTRKILEILSTQPRSNAGKPALIPPQTPSSQRKEPTLK
mgnify:FL=1